MKLNWSSFQEAASRTTIEPSFTKRKDMPLGKPLIKQAARNMGLFQSRNFLGAEEIHDSEVCQEVPRSAELSRSLCCLLLTVKDKPQDSYN